MHKILLYLFMCCKFVGFGVCLFLMQICTADGIGLAYTMSVKGGRDLFLRVGVLI